MELFPAQPDLSKSKQTSRSWRKEEEMDLGGLWKRANLDSRNSSFFDLSLSNNPMPSSNSNFQSFQQKHYYHQSLDHLDFLKPLRGIPIYHHQQKIAAAASSSNYTIPNLMMRSSRFPQKRTPRMRWTTTLHARFLRAVQLLGGHQRATPKSVLELMHVKDLTLAHVKSHLQMYRTVKTTDRAAASSDPSEGLMFDINSSARSDPSIKLARASPNEDNENFGFGATLRANIGINV